MSSVAKRTRSCTREEQKRLKIDLDDGKENEESSTTILDLNDDCLEEIFSYISQNDFLHIHQASSRFKFPSERAFARKCKKVPAIVSNQQTSLLADSIQFLEVFGNRVTKLRIKFKLEKCVGLLQAIQNHCDNEKINELELCHHEVRVKKPAYKYRTDRMEIMSFLRGLNAQFPNLVSLKVDYHNEYYHRPYFDSIIQRIPSLRSLSIYGWMLPTDLMRAFIALNNQLESFEYSSRLTFQLIDYLNESLPQLKNLKIADICYVSPRNDIPTRFKNLKKLEYGKEPGPYHGNGIPFGYMCCVGEGVEEMELFSFDWQLSNFAKGITSFKNLKRLVLHVSNVERVMKSSFFFYLHPQEIYVWSLHGIRQLFLILNQLTEIVVYRDTFDETYRGPRPQVTTWNRSSNFDLTQLNEDNLNINDRR